ncbi:MAG: NADH-quinone oxidoreductase subunit J [Intrasporangiaceae bacterium]|nr:NADH-quinone oxidoreductase subunit J [Intrasporangiaceae bacterium]
MFAVLALGAALAVITMRNIVHGALMLVVNLLAIAGLYLTLESSFLGVIQILVYAGAIMVLFLFVVMLLGVDRDDLLVARSGRTQIAAALGGVLLAGALLFAFVGPYTGPPSVCGSGAAIEVGSGQQRCVGLADQLAEDDGAGAAFLGERMFTRYTYAFELSALLLTVATIGAVILARRKDLEVEDLDAGLDDGGGLGPDGLGPQDHDPLAAIGADLAGRDPDPGERLETDPDGDTPTDEREG